MGSLIDLEKVDIIYRCNYVKLIIIWINIIIPPISLFFLIFGILRMLFVKKHKSFLTKLILIIFISEVIQSISKMLQMLKYSFEDERDNKSLDFFSVSRGIICEMQIVLAISSDYCSLFTTLLLTLRCYDIIKNNNTFFDKGHNEIIFVVSDIVISIFLGVIFLFIDRKIVEGNISYRYDVRDRCTYWCWLEHTTSLICFIFFAIILIFNIIFAFKTYCYLKKNYINLISESGSLGSFASLESMTKTNNENNYNEIKKDLLNNSNKKLKISREELKKIEEINLMRIKSLIYPLVTIIYWTFTAIYRIVDDSFMMEFDGTKDPYDGVSDEQNFFKDHFAFQITVQVFLVLYIFLSAMRGILYGLSFIAFEEKIFFNFCRKMCKSCLKEKNFEVSQGSINEPNTDKNTEDYSLGNLEENEEDDDDNDESKSDKKSVELV